MSSIGPGSSLLLLAEPPQQKPHLWFVLTAPLGAPPKVVAVMLLTAKRFTDPTVILDAGDHPFIRHPSSVHYSTAKFFSVPALERAILEGKCKIRDVMSPDLLARVQAGLLRSPFSIHAIRDVCMPLFGNLAHGADGTAPGRGEGAATQADSHDSTAENEES